MKVYKFSPKNYFGANTYVAVSKDEAVAVDPSVSFSEVKEALGEAKVRYILLTHCHFDHILKLDEWVEKTGAEVIIGLLDKSGLSDPITNCYKLVLGIDGGYYGKVTAVTESDLFSFGEMSVRIIATPGHTAGGVSYLIGDSLFAGDTVFAGGGYGRCDFPGGSEAELFGSISRICRLPDGITVYSGHGNDTTVSELKRYFK